MQKVVKLPSGATLKMNPAPFAVAKALHQAMLEEMRGINLAGKSEMWDLVKNIMCVGFSSPRIEQCLSACFDKVIYNSGKGDLKIDQDTFEPVEAREDYAAVCREVAELNVAPFMKGLYAEFKRSSSVISNFLS